MNSDRLHNIVRPVRDGRITKYNIYDAIYSAKYAKSTILNNNIHQQCKRYTTSYIISHWGYNIAFLHSSDKIKFYLSALELNFRNFKQSADNHWNRLKSLRNE